MADNAESSSTISASASSASASAPASAPAPTGAPLSASPGPTYQNAATQTTNVVYTIPRTDKPPSAFLLSWLKADEFHGYEFNEDVLFGRDPDTDWTEGYINQPNNWEEVIKCLRSEISGQKRLARSKQFRSEYNKPYLNNCKAALKEVMKYYV